MDKKAITRDQAREAFRASGLTYDMIRPRDLDALWMYCEKHLMVYWLDGNFKAHQMCMRMAKLRHIDAKFDAKFPGDRRGGMIHAALQVDGAYFQRREAITFSSSGAIGFGCELDDTNIQPILAAFVEWCGRWPHGTD